jgi:nucleotide-binding universal stress UspA family protein
MKPRILVPYDFSVAAERALAWSADLLRTSGGGELHLVNVVNPVPPIASVAGALPAYSEDEVRRVEASLRDAADRYGTHADAEVVMSPSIGESVVATARKQHVDLIVMGTHGRGGIARAMLGSVADYLVRHAECPVVTMRAPGNA